MIHYEYQKYHWNHSHLLNLNRININRIDIFNRYIPIKENLLLYFIYGRTENWIEIKRYDDEIELEEKLVFKKDPSEPDLIIANRVQKNPGKNIYEILNRFSIQGIYK